MQLLKIIVAIKGFDSVPYSSFFEKLFLRVMNLSKSGESFDHEDIDRFYSSLYIWDFLAGKN